MGNGFTLFCPECGYEIEAILGIGFAYHSLENVIDQVDRRRRARVLDILKKHHVIGTHYEHRFYRCDECGGLSNRFYVRIRYDDDRLYETVFKCGKCGIALSEVTTEEALRGTECPECKNGILEVRSSVMWD